MSAGTPLAVYIHWPFCRSKCPYCDFNSHVREGVDAARWTRGLLADLDHHAELVRERAIGSVFFGGGTPSLMPPETVAVLLDRVAAHWTMTPDVEVTLEANPNSGFSITNVLIDKPASVIENTPNLRLLRNLDEDITDLVIDYPSGGTRKCVFTVHQQKFTSGAHSCGFSSPAQNQSFTKNSTSTITFKFQALQSGTDCQHGPFLTDGMIQPLLMITQLVPPAAPNSIPVIVAGKSGGPPTFIFSGNTWQLQVKTSTMPAGTYVATVIDLKNVIPSFGVTFSLK